MVTASAGVQKAFDLVVQSDIHMCKNYFKPPVGAMYLIYTMTKMARFKIYNKLYECTFLLATLLPEYNIL
jgi:hypothetical protein